MGLRDASPARRTPLPGMGTGCGGGGCIAGLVASPTFPRPGPLSRPPLTAEAPAERSGARPPQVLQPTPPVTPRSHPGRGPRSRGSGSRWGTGKVSARRPAGLGLPPDLVPRCPSVGRVPGKPPGLCGRGMTLEAGRQRGRSRGGGGGRGVRVPSLTSEGSEGRMGQAGLADSPGSVLAAAVARQRQRQSARGRGRVRRTLRGRRAAASVRLPPPSRLRATDGAAEGMTGNSWARAAESKYEHRSRAREDRGARRPRTGPAAQSAAVANSRLLRRLHGPECQPCGGPGTEPPRSLHRRP